MSPEQIVTVVTGILQAGGLGYLFYHLIGGLRTRIATLEGTIKAQNETLNVMERRISETEKVGMIYKDLLSSLPKDLQNYKAVISTTKDEMILELQNANKQKDEELKKIREIDQSLAGHPQKARAKNLKVMRFLLEPKQEDFRGFLQNLCGTIDVAVDELIRNPELDAVIAHQGKTLIIEDDKAKWDALVKPPAGEKPASRLTGGSWSVMGWYGTFQDNRLVMSSSRYNAFASASRHLKVYLEDYD
jgi:hypothetical protein